MNTTNEHQDATQENAAPSSPETAAQGGGDAAAALPGEAAQGAQPATGEGAEADGAYEFSKLNGQKGAEPMGNLDFILDVPLQLTVELGRTKMMINELLRLGHGSVVELSKLAGETLDILANQRLIARGEVVVINEKYGIRITEIISPAERVERLR